MESEYHEIVYRGLTDDDTFAIFNVINGTIKILYDEGVSQRHILTGYGIFERYPDDGQFHRFGDLFSYIEMKIEGPEILYEGIDEDGSFVVINIETGIVKIYDNGYNVTQNFLLNKVL